MAGKSQNNGNEGERLFADLFKSFGYWALIISRNNQGSQPFDIITAKGYKGKLMFWMVDSKVVEKGELFPFSDIQPNQIESMNYAIRYAKVDPRLVGFAILFKSVQQMRFLTYEKFREYRGLGKASAKRADLLDLCDYVEDVEREIINN